LLAPLVPVPYANEELALRPLRKTKNPKIATIAEASSANPMLQDEATSWRPFNPAPEERQAREGDEAYASVVLFFVRVPFQRDLLSGMNGGTRAFL